jgi:hypothetical protein
MKYIVTLLFLFMCMCAYAQGPGQRIALINLQQSKVVESSRAGQIGLTDSQGNQRYAQYTEIDLVPISYTPTTTGNTQNYSEFVSTATGDIWYIDWQGRGIRLYSAASAGDYDWLEISNNEIPNSITDSVYTDNYASVNVRYVWPNAQFLAGDSTRAGNIVVLGQRESRIGFYRLTGPNWSSVGQEGNGLVARLGGSTSRFEVQSAGGVSPSQPATPYRSILQVNTDSTITLNDYPRTRNDTAAVVNFLYTDAIGVLRSSPVTELPGGSGLGLIPPVYNTTGAATVNLDLGSYQIFNLNLSETGVNPALNLQNPIPGLLYTVRWWNNSTTEELRFPNNVYVTQDTVSAHRVLDDPASRSGYVQMYYDTAFYTVSCVPPCVGVPPGPPPVVYDPSYQNVLTWATLAGISLPHDTIKAKQNQMVINLKAQGIWDSLGVFYVFASGADTAFANINWIDPTQYNVDVVGGVNYLPFQGYRSNDVDGYLNTNMQAYPLFTATSAHYGGWSYDNVTPINDSYIYSHWLGNASAITFIVSDANNSMFYKFVSSVGCNSNNNTITTTAGHFVAVNNGGSGRSYRNGVELADASYCTITGSTVADRKGILLASMSNIGSPPTNFSKVRLSMFHAGSKLGQPKLAQFHTIFNTYLNGL